MAEAPATRVTLLNRILDTADSEAWAEFARLYGPVVYGFARKRGLQDADAADLVQDVLRSVARNAHRIDYDPKRGTFRGWLYTVTRNKVYNFLRQPVWMLSRQIARSGIIPTYRNRIDELR